MVDWMGIRPPLPNAGIGQSIGYSVFNEARGQFFNTFATNSKASMLFAQSPGQVFATAFSNRIKEGSPAHISNLERAAKIYPKNEKIQSALKRARMPVSAGSKAMRFAGKALGPLATAGYLGYTAYSTPGGVYDKGKATAIAGAGTAGFAAGSYGGMVAGAALGSVLPGIGTFIGGVAGFVAGGFLGDYAASSATSAGFGFVERTVQNERSRRTWDWVGDQSAFNTRKAYTMRQMSLQAMNRGMMSSRSLLGKEAMYVHR